MSGVYYYTDGRWYYTSFGFRAANSVRATPLSTRLLCPDRVPTPPRAPQAP